MSEVVAVLVYVAPYILLMLLAGGAIGASSSWLFSNTQRWILYAVVLFSLVEIFVGDGGAEGSTFKQFTWGALFALAGLDVLGMTRGHMSWPFKLNPPMTLFLLIGFAVASITWSPLPLVSGKRVVQIVGVLVLAMVFARSAIAGVGLSQQLLGPVGVFLGIGLIVSMMFPSFAFDSDRSLRAISSHKNTWGQFSLLASIVFLFSIRDDGKRRVILVACVLIAAISLALSRSATSILAFVVIFSATSTWLLARSGVVGQVLIFIAATCVALATLGFTVMMGELPFQWAYDAVFRLTEKNQTLTGRTFLWQLMMGEIERHKWFGIGYGGFWLGLDGPSASVIARLNWGPPAQAHSGYIDVVNELGYVGLSFLVLVLISHIRKLAFLAKSAYSKEVAFHAALLVCALFVNYAESSLLRTTHFWWIVLCASIMEVHVLCQTLLVSPKASHSAPLRLPRSLQSRPLNEQRG